ncbi:MAG: NAD(P)-dependent oxidoreductase [Burkholderiales bacterium]|nr:NAD(P)-dependent oxidoreductase [Burkholderiales bacterium]
MSYDHVGFIGLGKMGGPMAARLLDHGKSVIVYDIDARSLDAAARKGAKVAKSPAAVAAGTDVICLCLPGLEIVRETAVGANGVCQGGRAKTLVDFSTTGPQFAAELGDDLGKRGITMLDCPISGGVKRAEQGKLTLVVSGAAAAFERVRPLLDIFGKTYYIGAATGQAQMMKLVNNLLSQISTAATYEAFVLGAKAGLDPDVMLDVINDSTGVNNCTLYKMPQSVLPRTFDYGVNMEITYKDITLCMKEADRLGVTMFLGNMARQLWGYGVNHGGAKRDSSTLITCFEEWAGVKVIGKAGRERGA